MTRLKMAAAIAALALAGACAKKDDGAKSARPADTPASAPASAPAAGDPVKKLTCDEVFPAALRDRLLPGGKPGSRQNIDSLSCEQTNDKGSYALLVVRCHEDAAAARQTLEADKAKLSGARDVPGAGALAFLGERDGQTVGQLLDDDTPCGATLTAAAADEAALKAVATALSPAALAN
jgi:hypothetical protein